MMEHRKFQGHGVTMDAMAHEPSGMRLGRLLLGKAGTLGALRYLSAPAVSRCRSSQGNGSIADRWKLIGGLGESLEEGPPLLNIRRLFGGGSPQLHRSIAR